MSEDDDEDEEEEDIPSWASKNPTKTTKWDRNHQRGKKNNENFIEKVGICLLAVFVDRRCFSDLMLRLRLDGGIVIR